MAAWPWWEKATGGDEHRIRELLRAVWDLHAMYGADDPWLWRGQANHRHRLEPAIHTRLRSHASLEDDEVIRYTQGLIKAAREAELDEHEGTRLPDMALLARLQHHGAATPLLDVSLDPVVGLYMATVSPNSNDDGRDGVLFAIQRPTLTISDFDSRPFIDVYDWIESRVALYSAPDVSERLRIQRGHFILGQVASPKSKVTVPLSVDYGPKAQRWLEKRMKKRGKPGPPPLATTDVGIFRLPARHKTPIRTWLEERSGLSRDFVYPTPWHQPHLERFAAAHGRRASF